MHLPRQLRTLAASGSRSVPVRSSITLPSSLSSTRSHSAAAAAAATAARSEEISPIPSDALKSFSTSTTSAASSLIRLSDHSSFFSSSRPNPSTSLPPTPIALREEHAFNRLKILLALPPSERDAKFAGEVWLRYRSLSPAFRRSLDIQTMQNVFRCILPNGLHVRQLVGSRENLHSRQIAKRAEVHRQLGEKWERRLRTIAADMMATAPDQIDLRIFVPALRKLAFVGDKSGCEAIINEIQHRYAGTDKISPRLLRQMYNTGLKSVSQWLDLNSHRWRHAQAEITEAIETTKRLVIAIQNTGSTPSPFTAKALLSTARHVSNTSEDTGIKDAFVRLTEVILTDGFGVDLEGIAWESNAVKNNEAVRLAVVHYLGSKGKLYHMLAAFDAMYPGPSSIHPASLAVSAGQLAEEDEIVPTLSAMLAAEKAERAGRGWFGRGKEQLVETAIASTPETEASTSETSPLTDTPQQARTFADFLSPIPTPLELRSRIGQLTDDQLERIAQSLEPSIYRPTRSDVPDESSVVAMLRHTWLAKKTVDRSDTAYKEIAIHALQLAVRAANAEQARWLGDVLAAVNEPNGAVEQPSANASGVDVDAPAIRVHPHWFSAAWRTARSSSTQQRRGLHWHPSILSLLEDSLLRLEQEKLILVEALSRLDGGKAESAAASVDEASATEAVQQTPQVEDTATAATQDSRVTHVQNQLEQLLHTQSDLEEIQATIAQQAHVTLERRNKWRQLANLRYEEELERIAMLPKKARRGGVRTLSRGEIVESKGDAQATKWDGQVQGQVALA